MSQNSQADVKDLTIRPINVISQEQHNDEKTDAKHQSKFKYEIVFPHESNPKKWEKIAQYFQHENKCKDLDSLEKALFLIRNDDPNMSFDTQTLRIAIKDLMKDHERKEFFNQTIPFMIKFLLYTPKIFCGEENKIHVLSQGIYASVELSKVEAACILVNAFFSTFDRKLHATRMWGGENIPSINFDGLFGSRSNIKARSSKIRMLLNYFMRIRNEKWMMEYLESMDYSDNNPGADCTPNNADTNTNDTTVNTLTTNDSTLNSDGQIIGTTSSINTNTDLTNGNTTNTTTNTCDQVIEFHHDASSTTATSASNIATSDSTIATSVSTTSTIVDESTTIIIPKMNDLKIDDKEEKEASIKGSKFGSLRKKEIIFTRICIPLSEIPNWSKSTKPLCDIEVSLNGCIEDSPDALQADFANEYIGGGVLGSGSVQEEIRFVINPELICSRLFCEKLKQNEAILIKGAEQYSRYSGYAQSLQYDGNYNDTNRDEKNGTIRTQIVAFDALMLAGMGFEQYQKNLIDRELRKAYVAFHTDDTFQTISTGNWGCGAFMGDKRLKFLLQWMAASEAKIPKKIIYYVLGNETQASQMSKIIKELKESNVTVGKLYDVLCEMHTNPEEVAWSPLPDIYSFIRKRLLQ